LWAVVATRALLLSGPVTRAYPPAMGTMNGKFWTETAARRSKLRTLRTALALLAFASSCASPKEVVEPPGPSEVNSAAKTGDSAPANGPWSNDEASAEVRLGTSVVEVGDKREQLRAVDHPYKISLVYEHVGNQMADKSSPYRLALQDDVEGVHIVSVLQSAAWNESGAATVVPQRTVLHMDGKPKARKTPDSWEAWSGVPLHIALLETKIEIWRAYAQWEGEEELTPEAVLEGDERSSLLSRLEEICPDLSPETASSATGPGSRAFASSPKNPNRCSPFLLTIDAKTKAKDLRVVLEAFDELGSRSGRIIHALVLLHGKREVQAIARNIQERGHVERGKVQAGRIQESIRGRSDEFGKCFKEGRGRGVQISGAVKVRFTIDETGKAKDAAAMPESEIVDEKVQACVLRTLSTLSFPAPEDGRVTITYPVTSKY
jgi:hypothetical protein